MTVDLFHRIDGPEDGPPVLMVHAFPTSHELWDLQVPALSETYRLIRPDLRGFGASPVPPPPYSMEDMAGDLIALLDRLGIDRVHYVGISMGGMIGQVMALTYPERLISLSLCMTTSVVPPDTPEGDHPDYSICHRLMRRAAERARSEGMAPIVDMCLDRWFTEDFIPSEQAQRVGRIVAANTPTGYTGGVDALCGFDVTDRLGEIAAPTLILPGELDLGTPVRCSEVLHAGIPGSSMQVIEGAKHIAIVEKPEPVNAALRAHLDAHS